MDHKRLNGSDPAPAIELKFRKKLKWIHDTFNFVVVGFFLRGIDQALSTWFIKRAPDLSAQFHPFRDALYYNLFAISEFKTELFYNDYI